MARKPPQAARRAPRKGRSRLLLVLLFAAAVGGASWWAFGVLEARSSPTAAGGSGAVPGPASSQVARLRVRVLRTLRHDPEAYTQGLLLDGDTFVESDGRYGDSSLRRWREDGSENLRVDLPFNLFAEGVARVGDRLFQLTWREGRLLIWDLRSLRMLDERGYEGEGWGLCFDGRRLVMSDGSDVLSFRDPESFAVLDRKSVEIDGAPVANLNELECAEGWIYANVYETDEIVRIDPTSGQVRAIIDASGLLGPIERRRAEVLNGIAYSPRTETFFVTGKNWPKLFEVVFEPQR